LAVTEPSHPVQTVELDLALSSAAKGEYPCYVSELE
jgi:hypothetical protein